MNIIPRASMWEEISAGESHFFSLSLSFSRPQIRIGTPGIAAERSRTHADYARSHRNLRTTDYDPRNIWSTAIHTALSPTVRTDRFREESPGLPRGRLPRAVPPGSATARRIIPSTCVTFTFSSSKNDFPSADKRNFYVLMRSYDAEPNC